MTVGRCDGTQGEEGRVRKPPRQQVPVLVKIMARCGVGHGWERCTITISLHLSAKTRPRHFCLPVDLDSVSICKHSPGLATSSSMPEARAKGPRVKGTKAWPGPIRCKVWATVWAMRILSHHHANARDLGAFRLIRALEVATDARTAKTFQKPTTATGITRPLKRPLLEISSAPHTSSALCLH